MPQTDMSPSQGPYAITPDDSNNLSPPIRCFSIAVGGDVKVTRFDGTEATLTLPAGICPAQVIRIWSTGTTATGFVGYP